MPAKDGQVAVPEAPFVSDANGEPVALTKPSGCEVYEPQREGQALIRRLRKKLKERTATIQGRVAAMPMIQAGLGH
jgi:hypothetical protein